MNYSERIEELKSSVMMLADALDHEPPDITSIEIHWKSVATLWNERKPHRVGKPQPGTWTNARTTAYRRSDQASFEAYCASVGIEPSSQNVVRYGEWLLSNDYAPLSVYRQINSIERSQILHGITPCTILDQVKSFIVRLNMTPHEKRFVPVVRRQEMKAMLRACPNHDLGWRDRVMLLLFWELRPNSEIIRLRWDQIDVLPNGIVHIQIEKHNPPVEINPDDDGDFCLDVALSRWGALHGRDGQVLKSFFCKHKQLRGAMSPLGFSRSLKQCAVRAGLSPQICLRSFRRSVRVSRQALARLGKKGIAA